MARISMMLVGVVAVATGIAFALTMPREKTEPMQAPAAPVKKADLTPPPTPPHPKLADKPPEDPVDPAIEAADLQDGEGS